MATKKTAVLPAAAVPRAVVGLAHEDELLHIAFRATLVPLGIVLAVEVETVVDLEVALRGTPGVQVLVVHLILPMKKMLAGLERLMRRSKLPVIVMGVLNGGVVADLMQLDVRGVLPNSVKSTELAQATSVVAQGGIHSNHWMLDHLKQRRKRPGVAEQRSAVKLTAKQAQTAQWLYAHPDLSIPALALFLNMNIRTLESRKDALFKKLNVPNRAAFMKYQALYG